MQNELQERIENALAANDERLLMDLFFETMTEKISFGEYLEVMYRKKKGLTEKLTREKLIEGICQEFRKNGMYKLQLDKLRFPRNASREEKEKWLFCGYEYKDLKKSSKAIMGSIDFLSYTRTLDSADLKKRFEKSVDKVTREELFLFAFGLDFTVEEVQDFIQKYLGEPGIRWKDYKELIYFWCLRNKDENADSSYLGIEGVYRALRYYYKTPIAAYNLKQPDTNTYYYQARAAESGTTDLEFYSYLGTLKERQQKDGFSMTRSTILKENLKSLHSIISEEEAIKMETKQRDYEKCDEVIEKRGFSWRNKEAQNEKKRLLNHMQNVDVLAFERDVWSCVNEAVSPLFNDETSKKIGFPAIWRNGLIGEKLNSHKRDITRKDILISIFLKCAYCREFDKIETMQYEEFSDKVDLLTLKENFEARAGLDLASCEMHEGLYLPNPFELFLLLCLRSAAPYSMFMKMWDRAATNVSTVR